ncbi:rubrerythrin-related protein [Pyrococcus sp. NA2]|uniref:ferritin-like domain-containing protein n=1 Tax=Pyrococcus sp. (strain NA2) TaxID=342949 RepID=UPI000209A9AF|nr:ferritin family protein [Pyrococcus sp. NA2]AEC52516.1 rubrerythrin-related protein [Pyrococcus sp. NA2]
MKEIDILRLALEIEKAELKFYLNLARKVSDERARKMFLFLANEEANHWEIFEKEFLEKLVNECEMPRINNELVERLIFKEIREGELSEIDAVKIGMEQEKLTWEFYERAAKEAKSEELRKVFKNLARIEKAHYELMKAQYDSIMKTGIWMDYQDFSLEVD